MISDAHFCTRLWNIRRSSKSSSSNGLIETSALLVVIVLLHAGWATGTRVWLWDILPVPQLRLKRMPSATHKFKHTRVALGKGGHAAHALIIPLMAVFSSFFSLRHLWACRKWGFYLLSFGSRLGSFLSSAKRRLSEERGEKKSTAGLGCISDLCYWFIFM